MALFDNWTEDQFFSAVADAGYDEREARRGNVVRSDSLTSGVNNAGSQDNILSARQNLNLGTGEITYTNPFTGEFIGTANSLDNDYANLEFRASEWDPAFGLSGSARRGEPDYSNLFSNWTEEQFYEAAGIPDPRAPQNASQAPQEDVVDYGGGLNSNNFLATQEQQDAFRSDVVEPWNNLMQSTEALYALEGTGQNVFQGGPDSPASVWFRDMRALEKADPELFMTYLRENPEAGVKYAAQMATGGLFVEDDIDTKYYQQLANALAYYQAQEAGYGEDGTLDGKAFVSGYGQQWDDVNSEWGGGDFWKLGRPGAVSDGVLAWAENNPLQAAAMVASLFAPQLGPMLGITSTGGQAALQGALAYGASDGDIVSTLLAGGTPFLTQWLTSPETLNSIGQWANMSPEEIATVFNFAGDGVQAAETANNGISAGQVLNAVGTAREVGDLQRDSSIVGSAFPEYNDPNEVNSAQDLADFRDDEFDRIQTNVDDLLRVEDLTPWDWEPPTNASGGGGSSTGGTPGDDEVAQSEQGGDLEQARENEDVWVFSGGVLVNETTGATREVPNPGRMEEGGLYNGDGDPIGDSETSESQDSGESDEEDGLGTLIAVLGGLATGNHDWGSILGDITGGSGGGGTTGGGTSTGTGSDTTDTGGSGDGDGTGTGDGSGDGEGDGDGDGDGGPDGSQPQPQWGSGGAGWDAAKLFEYFGIKPSQAAVLGALVDYTAGNPTGKRR